MAKPLDWTYDSRTGEIRRESRIIGTFAQETGVFVYVSRDAKEKYRAKIPKILKENCKIAINYTVDGESTPSSGSSIVVNPATGRSNGTVSMPPHPEPTGPLGDRDPAYVRLLHDHYPEAFIHRYQVLCRTPGPDGRYPAGRNTCLTIKA